MWNKIKQYFKSRTVNVSLVIAMLGVLETNFLFLQPYYAILMVYLRSITTNSISEK